MKERKEKEKNKTNNHTLTEAMYLLIACVCVCTVKNEVTDLQVAPACCPVRMCSKGNNEKKIELR